MKLLKNFDGFATIPTILVLSMLILVVATGVVALTSTEILTASVQKQSVQSLRYAEAGAKDALMRITRNKNYSCATVDCYSLDLVSGGCVDNTGCAKITVSEGIGAPGDPKIIISEGIVENKTRRVEVRVFYDSSGYGEISDISWVELTD